MTSPSPAYESLHDYSILFADIAGFSKLTTFQQRQYLDVVLPAIAAPLQRAGQQPAQVRTWGDGLMAYFNAQGPAIHCALALRDVFRTTLWDDQFGLPDLRIRIALHAGEVFKGINPVTGDEELIGTEVNRAARVEPIVAPNHVYVTKDFKDRCKAKTVKFHLLGNIDLPKQWGSEELYVAGWQSDNLDPAIIRANLPGTGVFDSAMLVNYFRTSKFGLRLSVSAEAKAAIAQHCVASNFWAPEDVVFLESGTLPVHMLFELCRRRDPTLRPKLLICNNIVCALISMMDRVPLDETEIVYPKDESTNTILIGGRVLEDYAATIPQDLMVGPASQCGASQAFFDYLHDQGVNHIVMMVSRLTRQDGPCAVSTSMRRFKKLLLRYVAKHEDARLSILAEADKLIKRPGWAADTVGIPGHQGENYWEAVLKSNRANVIVAVSPEMPIAEIGFVKRELKSLQNDGAACVLLDPMGQRLDI